MCRPFFCGQDNVMKLTIIIPAYNEEDRIKKTVQAYHDFFSSIPEYTTEFIIVLNGCTDNTAHVIRELQQKQRIDSPPIVMIELSQAGKGRAIKAGFLEALCKNDNLIGFVDADMATAQELCCGHFLGC